MAIGPNSNLIDLPSRCAGVFMAVAI
jgi:hypothetical protein